MRRLLRKGRKERRCRTAREMGMCIKDDRVMGEEKGPSDPGAQRVASLELDSPRAAPWLAASFRMYRGGGRVHVIGEGKEMK